MFRRNFLKLMAISPVGLLFSQKEEILPSGTKINTKYIWWDKYSSHKCGEIKYHLSWEQLLKEEPSVAKYNDLYQKGRSVYMIKLINGHSTHFYREEFEVL